MKLVEINSKIKTKTPFAFSRWGDGEWANVNKVKGQNRDECIYFEDLGDELYTIVSEEQDYFLGNQTLITSPYFMTQSPQKWIDADVFHKASIEGKLDSFIQVLYKTPIVYIGNPDLQSLPFINTFISIPYKNVWLDKDSVLKSIRNTFNTVPKVYLFSAGVATNVFIDILWKENSTNTYIDVGSVFDPYVGKKTRSYHQSLKVTPLNNKN